MEQTNWKLSKFSSLSTEELYALLRLRSMVFHLEQNCAYIDTDNKDQPSLHLMGFRSGKMIAYARILPAGVSFNEVSIGRVATHPDFRGKGEGKALMKKCLEVITEQYGSVPVRIGAQCYLEKFYREFGFIPQGKEYLEDNIPHIEMIR